MLRIATPHVMVERVRWWLAESAHGRLHGVNQPLDPSSPSAGRRLVLPPAGQFEPSAGPLAAVRIDEQGGRTRLPDRPRVEGERGGAAPLLGARRHHRAPPRHRGIRRLPRSLGELVGIYAELGHRPRRRRCATAFRRWAALPDVDTMLTPSLPAGRLDADRARGRCGRAHRHQGLPYRRSIRRGRRCEALRALVVAGGSVSSPFPDEAPDVAAMRPDRASPRSTCTPRWTGASRERRAGRDGVDGDDRAATLVGAGALGSQLALCAARMGIGRWTIVDPDYLLPHNLARHALLARHVGMAKADGARWRDRGQSSARCGAADRRSASRPEAAAAALDGVDLVIDASASVPVARWLALEAGHVARTVSVFLNPNGDDLVILREGTGRTPASTKSRWRSIGCSPPTGGSTVTST